MRRHPACRPGVTGAGKVSIDVKQKKKKGSAIVMSNERRVSLTLYHALQQDPRKAAIHTCTWGVAQHDSLAIGELVESTNRQTKSQQVDGKQAS